MILIVITTITAVVKVKIANIDWALIMCQALFLGLSTTCIDSFSPQNISHREHCYRIHVTNEELKARRAWVTSPSPSDSKWQGRSSSPASQGAPALPQPRYKNEAGGALQSVAFRFRQSWVHGLLLSLLTVTLGKFLNFYESHFSYLLDGNTNIANLFWD